MKRQHIIAEVFDEVSQRYDGVMDLMVPHYRTLINAMFEYLPQSFTPARILDLGCGNGNSACVAQAMFPEAEIHLVDASEKMLSLCRDKMGNGRYLFAESTFQELTLPSDHYDLIYACFSLHHLDISEKRSIFGLTNRSLRQDGVLACADLFVDKRSRTHQDHLLEWKSFCISNGKTEEDWEWLMDHYDRYDKPHTYEDQRTWLGDAGFRNVSLSWSRGHWGCYHATK